MNNYVRRFRVTDRYSVYRKVEQADVVITFSHRNGIEVIKNRDGECKSNMDLADVLEVIEPFQKTYLQQLIAGWITKLKTYRVFS